MLLFLCKKGGKHIFDGEQILKIRWNNTNREWYKSKGYTYTKRNDIFEVKAKDLSIHSSAKINVICDYCGKEYITQYALITNGRKIISKDCCPHCTGKKTSEVSWKRRAEKHILLAQKACEENGYKLLTTIDEYVDTKSEIYFECKKHGKQSIMLDNFVRSCKCAKCSYEERGNNLKHNVNYIIKRIEEVNGNILINPHEYQGSTINNLNICCSCGNIFTTSYNNYIRAGVNTCFSCSCKESSGEKRIRKFLENNKINFIQEKRFDDCRDKKPLPFDFYLQEYNLIIEFDGMHHFKEIGLANHEITKKHDEIKNQYCKLHNIDLLRIPYWDGNDIENILKIKLNL